jgi:hypothetical protein
MTIFQITLVITIIFMGNFLASLERKSPKLFWGLILMLMLIFTSFDKDSLIYNHNTSPSYTEQTISNIRSGSEPTKKIVIIQTSLGKRKINIVTHRRLEKFFPDWEGRIAYQKNREKVYKAAMIKRREALRLRKKEDFGRTKDEQDAIDYFLGTYFYQIYQSPIVKPNIFDNRQSFLIKMHNKEMRMNFLKSFNRRHTVKPLKKFYSKE